MSYRLQLRDAMDDDSIKNVSDVCVTSPEFVQLINKVTRRLMKRGNWFDTEQLVRLCVYGCDIVWPRYVGTVLGVRSNCAGSVDIRNEWYSILGPSGCRNFCSNVTISDAGTVPCFNEITGNTGKFLRYHIVKQQDLGKTITFYGKQYGAQPLQELVGGAWQMGLTLAAQTPIAQTTTLVTKTTSVTRQATQGMAYVYQFDPATSDLIMLAAYEPNETNPRYRRSTISNMCALPNKTDSYGRRVGQVEALVKLAYIPVVNENDFLLIDDLDALSMGIQATKEQEARNFEAAEVCFVQAIRELNMGDRDKQPGNQTVIKVNVMGSRRVITNMV